MNQTKKEVHVLMYQYYNENNGIEYAIDVDDAHSFETIVSQKKFPTLREINIFVDEEIEKKYEVQKKVLIDYTGLIDETEGIE